VQGDLGKTALNTDAGQKRMQNGVQGGRQRLIFSSFKEGPPDLARARGAFPVLEAVAQGWRSEGRLRAAPQRTSSAPGSMVR